MAGAARSTLHSPAHRHGYGFSVFWLPLSRAIGLTAPGLAGDDRWFFLEDCMGKT